MQRTAVQNRKQMRGVSLIEVMIALVILLFIFMGLLQTSLLTMDTNVSNELRDEGVRVGSDRISELRSIGFGHARLTATVGLVADNDPDTVANESIVSRRFRSRQEPVRFTVQKQVTDLDANTKNLVVQVSWLHSGETLTHTINAVVKR